MRVHKVISGGQTGADQAGLRAARDLGICTGGTAPADFYTDKGPNYTLMMYGLTAYGTYNERTKQNIVDSDATLVIVENKNSPGSKLTVNLLKELQKPFYVANVAEFVRDACLGYTRCGPVPSFVRLCEDICLWLDGCPGAVLNVAGNRERYQNGLFGSIAEELCRTVFTVQGELNYTKYCEK